jgi:hypothetical protein
LSRRWRCFLLKDTIDFARTDPDELGNLLFVASLPIQLPDPLMKFYLLAMTRLPLLCDFFRDCRLLSRACFTYIDLYYLFEHVFLLAKELLQGFSKVLRVA